MKPLLLILSLLVAAPHVHAQTWADLTPEQQEALIYKSAVAVWTRLDPQVRQTPRSKEILRRMASRPVWRNWSRAERINKVTYAITNFEQIKARRIEARMAAALAENSAAYPPPPSSESLAQIAAPPEIAAIPATGDPVVLASEIRVPDVTEAPALDQPDLFTINRQFNWARPSGQWMNQMLKDIDAAKAAGDTATYERLTRQYTAWADQYLKTAR